MARLLVSNNNQTTCLYRQKNAEESNVGVLQQNLPVGTDLIGADGADDGADFARVFGVHVDVLPTVEPTLLVEQLAVGDADHVLGLCGGASAAGAGCVAAGHVAVVVIGWRVQFTARGGCGPGHVQSNKVNFSAKEISFTL